MRAISLVVLILIFIGCNRSSDTPKIPSTSTPPPSPDSELSAGVHEIDDRRTPAVFIASIGGSSGPSFKVEMIDNGNLMYHQNPNGFIEDGGTSTEIMVTGDMWNHLIERLNSVEVWKWRRRYDAPNIADGTVWKLRLEYPDQSIVSSGGNAYPKQGRFDAFLDAVSDLADGSPFE